jgi:hypothetical protein
MWFSAKPASKSVKITPLKAFKDAVLTSRAKKAAPAKKAVAKKAPAKKTVAKKSAPAKKAVAKKTTRR